jgi:membrane complex biogenesis BtpA family protein
LVHVANPRLSTTTPEAVFGTRRPLIGVLHLPPLPGSPLYDGTSMAAICDYVLRDADTLANGGLDALMIENAGDIPYLRSIQLEPETAACMAVVLGRVTSEHDCATGVICLSNGVETAMAVAKAGGGRFVRANLWTGAYVADAGIIESPAGMAMRYRKKICAEDILVMADVHVKHGAHTLTSDRPVSEHATDAEYFGADMLIATGQRTGDATPTTEVEAIKAGTVLPVYVGSGLSPENAAALMSVADGAIIGSYFRREGRWWQPVDQERVEKLMLTLRRVLSATQH